MTQPNFADILCQRALQQPEAIAYQWMNGEGQPQQTITYQQLANNVRRLAAALLTVAEVGDRAIVLHDQPIDFITALLACLYAGIIAVPVSPPFWHKKQANISWQRWQNILRDASPRLLLTSQSIINTFEKNDVKKSLSSLFVFTTDTLNVATHGPLNHPLENQHGIALLQYTSGSTGHPKGVMLTHHNLINNVSNILSLKAPGYLQSAVCWLPLYHDMGIITGVFLPLFAGIPSILLSTLDFLRNPTVWLRLISSQRGVISGGPNFAYELCSQKINQCADQTIDLSHWQVAFVGSETNQVSTYQKFMQKFAAVGFQAHAFCPCYGLAEATVYVSGSHVGELPTMRSFNKNALTQGKAVNTTVSAESMSLMSVGRPFSDHALWIVDPVTHKILPENTIGEIWLQGPSVAKGYWQQASLTKKVFNASTADQKIPYLRTGDLGFIADGELFLYGRLKDLIIIRGKCFSPEDIEWTVQQADVHIRPQGVAAFSILESDEEKLVIVAEIKKLTLMSQEDQITQHIRECITQNFGIHLHRLLLIPPKTLPKTANGKIQRQQCRRVFLSSAISFGL